MFEHSSTGTALKSIKNTLTYSLKNEYGIEDDTLAEKLLSLHGMSKNNFDFINNMETIISSRVNDVSIDDNSNKNEKTIPGIHSEVTASINKIVGYRYLYRKIVELYGKEEAKRLTGKMYDYSLALADSSKILVPYCFSVDASTLVLQGRDFGVIHSKPANRINSYIAQLNETVHQLSNHVAGAIAIATIFIDMAHILIFKEKLSLEEIKTNEQTRKYIENAFQCFVHSVNHLSRNAVESPFTNISIFDREKNKALIAKDNRGWYFEGVELDYAIDYIMELQKIFIDFFDKGDPMAGGLQYRFPVVTLNVTIKKNGVNKVLDETFLDYICSKEIYRYNIFVSEGEKLASCCRLINDTELMSLGGTVNSFGGSNISLGSHRVVTLNLNRFALESKSYEDYFDILKKRIDDSAKILKAHKTLIKDLEDKGLQPFIKNGWLRLDRMFSTFGVLGSVEASDTLKNKFKITSDPVADTLVKINTWVKEKSLEYGIIGNIEQIPAESMAVRLPEADRLLFGEELVPDNLYANQFIPLWEKASLWERMEIDGKYQKLFTGGNICHFSLGEKVTQKQAKKIIHYAIEKGSEHFALNAIYSKCEHDHTTFGKSTVCPTCGGKIVDYYTRVVGFFVPVSSMNKTRREWEIPKRDFEAVE